MKSGMKPQIHITEKPSQCSWRSSHEPRGSIQTLPLAFALDTGVTVSCFSFLLCETFKPQVEHSMHGCWKKAGTKLNPCWIYSPILLSELPLEAAHTGGQLAGKLWVVGGIFPFWGRGVVLGQDYMNSISRVDLHAFYPPNESNEQI